MNTIATPEQRAQAMRVAKDCIAASNALVTTAAARIYAAWLPLIGETEAREQAQAFARRFQITEHARS